MNSKPHELAAQSKPMSCNHFSSQAIKLISQPSKPSNVPINSLQQLLPCTPKQILTLYLSGLFPPETSQMVITVRQKTKVYLKNGQNPNEVAQYLKLAKQFFSSLQVKKIRFKKDIFLDDMKIGGFNPQWQCKIYTSQTVKWAILRLLTDFSLHSLKNILKLFQRSQKQPEIILVIAKIGFIDEVVSEINHRIDIFPTKSEYLKITYTVFNTSKDIDYFHKEQIIKDNLKQKSSVQSPQYFSILAETKEEKTPIHLSEAFPILQKQDIQQKVQREQELSMALEDHLNIDLETKDKDGYDRQKQIIGKVNLNGLKDLDFMSEELKVQYRLFQKKANSLYHMNPENHQTLLQVKRLYTSAIDLSCKSKQIKSQLYSNRAFISYKLGLLDDSINDSERSLAMNSLNLNAIFHKIRLLLDLNSYDQARKIIKSGNSTKFRFLQQQVIKRQRHYQYILANPPLILCSPQWSHNLDQPQYQPQYQITPLNYNCDFGMHYLYNFTPPNEIPENNPLVFPYVRPSLVPNYYALMYFSWSGRNPACQVLGVFTRKQMCIDALYKSKPTPPQYYYLKNSNGSFYAIYLPQCKKNHWQDLELQVYIAMPAIHSGNENCCIENPDYQTLRNPKHDEKNGPVFEVCIQAILPYTVTRYPWTHFGAAVEREIRLNTNIFVKILNQQEANQRLVRQFLANENGNDSSIIGEGQIARLLQPPSLETKFLQQQIYLKGNIIHRLNKQTNNQQQNVNGFYKK